MKTSALGKTTFFLHLCLIFFATILPLTCIRALAQAANGGMSSDPTSVAARRCLELGGTTAACLGSSLMGGIISTFTGGTDLNALTGPGRAGVILSGAYGQSATAPNITFSGDSAAINNCGKLVADGHGYTLVKSAGPLKVNIVNQSNPIVLTMRSDGSLAGPGLVTVTGRVITGYYNVTRYVNGVATGTTSTPTYGPATAHCAIGLLAAPPPVAASSDSPPSSGIFGIIAGIAGTVASPSLPGLRMEGKYFSSSSLILDFAGDAVTMDCGQAHIKAPYTVANNSASFTVSVQNPGGPFDLTVAPNNILQGSGSTTVNGRLVSGMDGDNVTFMPHSESCKIATFTSQAAATAPGTGMKLNVTSTFPTATNPLAGKPVKLMTDRFDNALRSVGAPVPPGTTPGHALQAWPYACNPSKNCAAAAKLMARFYVGRGTFDSTGKVVLTAPIAPGTYYVFCSVAGTKGVLVWDLQTTLKAGDNTINLTAANAELVQ